MLEFCQLRSQLVVPNQNRSDSRRLQSVDSKNEGVPSLSYGRLNGDGVLPLAELQLRIEFVKKLEDWITLVVREREKNFLWP